MSTSEASWLTPSTTAPSRGATAGGDFQQAVQALERLFEQIMDSLSQASSADGQGTSAPSPQPDTSSTAQATPTANGSPSTEAASFAPPVGGTLTAGASPDAGPPQAASPDAASPGIAAADTASAPAALTQSTDDASAAGTPATAAGSGPNSITITNTSSHDEKIGEFLNGGSTTTPAAEIDLKPGQSGTLRYANGQGGFDAEADSSGQFKPDASRLEFYADQNGRNSPDVSYIDGRNASISLSDGKGGKAGDDRSIASGAPADAITRDAAGNATIAGWYDGSTTAMQDGGAYMQAQLGTGSSYIHPDDDQNKAAGSNPMTLAEDTSQTYTAQFGDA
ncbi:MAG: hypothetical protein ACRYG8_06380 [Janthinobacterium lividum]